jgi:hypothetical protein
VLEAQSGALEQASERFIGLQSRSDRLGSLVTDNTRDINELQAGLPAKGCQRLGERLRGNVGGERGRFGTLG